MGVQDLRQSKFASSPKYASLHKDKLARNCRETCSPQPIAAFIEYLSLPHSSHFPMHVLAIATISLHFHGISNANPPPDHVHRTNVRTVSIANAHTPAPTPSPSLPPWTSPRYESLKNIPSAIPLFRFAPRLPQPAGTRASSIRQKTHSPSWSLKVNVALLVALACRLTRIARSPIS